MAQCDAVYYVDPFNRNRFIRSDAIFSIAHEEQVAELRHIAEKLGAKKCSIEIKEEKREFSKSDKKGLRALFVFLLIAAKLFDF